MTKKHKLKLTKEWLQTEYVDKHMSASQIAHNLNCTQGAILYWLKKWNIPRRSVQEASYLANYGDKNACKRPEVLEKISGKNNHFFGKHHSEEAKQKISDFHKNNIESLKRLEKARNSDVWKKAMSENNPMHREDVKAKHLEIIRNTRSGINSNFWRGGVSKLNKRIRVLSEYKEWRNAVFVRDTYTCQFCGHKGGELQADHIKSFAVILEENNIKTIEEAQYCSYLWDINNGRTLCIECHKTTDTYMHKNTPQSRKKCGT